MRPWDIIRRRDDNHKAVRVQESYADLQNKLDLRTRELQEALQQQAATGEILRAISRSPTDLESVLGAIAESAARLLGVADAEIFMRVEGDVLRLVAGHGPSRQLSVGHELPINRNLVVGRAVLDRTTVHVPDLQAAESDFPESAAYAKQYGHRTILATPLLREGNPIGAIFIRRMEVRPLTDKQIALLGMFADQAVIAIENTRLLNELRQRTTDLSESLEQQTATSEVLRVISRSSSDLASVFESILANATRICEAKFGTLDLRDGDSFRAVAMHNAPPAYMEARTRGPVRPARGTTIDRAAETKQAVQIADVTAEEPYLRGDPFVVTAVKLGGLRTVVSVPMVKEDELIGVITIYRQEVRPFTNKQIALVQNFAAQAVIAIENTRLLNELRQSLEQQTATSEVLGVISRSSGDLAPVFQAMLENATRICDAAYGVLWSREGDAFRMAGLHGDLPAQQWRIGTLHRPSPDVPLARVAKTHKPVHVADMRKERGYLRGDPLPVAAVEGAGMRTLIIVPMLKDNEAVGAISIYRKEVRPFTEKQIALVQNFAAQAVIAIENTRLLNELRESLQQQTATADVLKVISRSTFDLQTVLRTLVESAARLCEADNSTITRQEGTEFFRAAAYGYSPEFLEYIGASPIEPGRGTVHGRALLEGRVIHIPDALADPEYTWAEAQRLGGFRTLLGVPMLREGVPIGVLTLSRSEVRPFTEKQIQLVSTFADQAAIAIENVRLFDQVQSRNRDLAEALEQQTATAEILRIISTSPSNLQPVLEVVVKSAARFCGADDVSVFELDGQDLRSTAHWGPIPQEMGMRVPCVRGSVGGRTVLEQKPVHVVDLQAETEEFPQGSAFAKRLGHRATLGVPLLREGVAFGTIQLRRTEANAFTDKQIELLKSFADQAVIAIENVRLFDEIQEKSRQLAEASQHKSQFLANMSHELRTPLNAILGYTELILDNIYGDTPDKMRGVLLRIESNGKHLLGLINDVLDLSKIEAGQLTLSLADYSLKSVVQTVFSAVEPLAREKKLAFKIEVPSDMPGGHGDERRLTQVLLNLVGNAIKFTDAGEVVIKASTANGSFNVAVRDTGPGISAADQAKLFQEFQQADNSATKKKGGTGLGLAISKRIIEMHGGRIWAESVVGQGSTFSFTLPVTVEQQVRQA
jgi:GAF domain-containing protein